MKNSEYIDEEIFDLNVEETTEEILPDVESEDKFDSLMDCL